MMDERLLDLESEEIESAYRDGALAEHEARRMQAEVDRKRLVLYASMVQDAWDDAME